MWNYARPEELPLAVDPLFLLDYDGTLAPLVDDPELAFPQPGTETTLTALGARYNVHLVTGRNLHGLEPLLPVRLAASGLHGLQEGMLGEEPYRDLAPPGTHQKLQELIATIPEYPNRRLENKVAVLAIHFRQSPDKEAVREMLEAWRGAVPAEFHTAWGKDVIEIRPAGAGKGRAVQRLVKHYAGLQPVFIGDDASDEEAFAAIGRDGLTIKVGEGETRARFRIRDPEAVLIYLRRYLAA